MERKLITKQIKELDTYFDPTGTEDQFLNAEDLLIDLQRYVKVYGSNLRLRITGLGDDSFRFPDVYLETTREESDEELEKRQTYEASRQEEYKESRRRDYEKLRKEFE